MCPLNAHIGSKATKMVPNGAQRDLKMFRKLIQRTNIIASEITRIWILQLFDSSTLRFWPLQNANVKNALSSSMLLGANANPVWLNGFALLGVGVKTDLT